MNILVSWGLASFNPIFFFYSELMEYLVQQPMRLIHIDSMNFHNLQRKLVVLIGKGKN